MKLLAISEMCHFKYNENYFLHDFHVTSKLSFYAVRTDYFRILLIRLKKVKIGLWNSLDPKGKRDINYWSDILLTLIYNASSVLDLKCHEYNVPFLFL